MFSRQCYPKGHASPSLRNDEECLVCVHLLLSRPSCGRVLPCGLGGGVEADEAQQRPQHRQTRMPHRVRIYTTPTQGTQRGAGRQRGEVWLPGEGFASLLASCLLDPGENIDGKTV